MVLLPEAIFGPYKEPYALIQKDTEFLHATFKSLAKKHGIYLQPGTFWTFDPQKKHPKKALNTAFFYTPEGELAAWYHKIHLFDVVLKNGEEFLESKKIQKGSHLSVIHTPFGNIGMGICFDLRFAGMFAAMSHTTPLDMIILPSNFTHFTGQSHYEILLRARAIENQCFVMSANQWGEQHNQSQSYGNSMVIGPWGDIMSRAPATADTTIYAEIHLEKTREVRENFCLKRKPYLNMNIRRFG